MAEILKEWLTERLQRPIKWEAQEFGDMMKNGHIVATVLHSYHAINEEKLFLIRPSDLPNDVKSNWIYLREWLRELDIFLNEQELNNIIEGKGSAFLRLFYQLFLQLDKRDRTNFLKRERKMVSNLVEKMENRFIVEAVDETQEADVDYLSKPLINERHYIDWQKKKTQEIKEAQDFVRHKFKKALARIEDSKTPCHTEEAPKAEKLTSKDKEDIAKFSMKHPCAFKNYTYEQLLNLEEESAERKKLIIDSEWAKAYMDDLYHRIHKKTDSEQFQKELRNALSNSLWDLSVGHEEAEADLSLAKTVMKLSQFEKQMCTQIMETKQQARNLTKNRRDAELEFADQRDLQFHQYLDNLREQLHLEVVEIDFEKQRQEVLHQRLYAEKMKRKRQHWYEICYETMLSIVDYATKLAFWTRLLENDLPDHFIHEWKNLYFKKQPIFDILEPMDDLLKEHALEEEPEPEVEEIIRLELDRQQALNDCEFLEYHTYSHPWTLESLVPNYDPENENRKFEYLGYRILGHVVYTLKQIKYPYVPPRSPADLPWFPSKAIVRGLPDKAIALPMQSLLAKSKIHVVRLEAAVNFCLKKFKHEMVGCTDIDLQYDKFIAVQTDETGKEFIKSLKLEEEQTRSSDASVSVISGPVPPNCKQTQTPKTLPEEDITLSASADLGKYAYEALSFGDSLTDHLISAMLVEYIKEQNDINGFVIINYPNSYREAQVLEETFQGREPPDEAELMEVRDDIYLEETIAKHKKKEKDPHKELRKSRLVEDPHKRKRDLPFESYFTCYLRMKETDDILQEYVIWDLTEDNSELIDRFYAALGVNYSVYYELIEKDLLAQICTYVIGDLNLPFKSHSILFGENVLSELDFPTSDVKRLKSKIVKPEVSFIKSKEKLKRLSSKGSKSLSNLEVLKPEVPYSNTEVPYEQMMPIEEVVGEEQSKVSLLSEVKILPGEEEWTYAELQMSETIGVALASLWEEIERVYIHDLQQMFFSIRLQMNAVVPYCRFIKDKMEQIMTLPSFKQDLVSQFQKEYNEFEYDWRDINTVKNEWHCRIMELQQRLYNICDERKLFSEQQKHGLQTDNWVAEELTSMANSFISCMQAELNRSVLTFQILHDFYFASLKKMPTADKIIPSALLIKINKEPEDVSAASHGFGATSSKKLTEDKIYRQLKHAFLEKQVQNMEIEFTNNPVYMILENNVKLATKTVKEINDHQRFVVASEYNEIAKMVPVVKKKEDESSVESVCSEGIFKENGLKAVEEWIMAINGEMYRVNQRLVAIQFKCLHEMRLMNNTVRRAFEEIQTQINILYMNEIKSVDRLCKYMQMAVENGKRIPETLILEHDNFIIDPNLLQFEPSPTQLATCYDENIDMLVEFKLNQLARLRSQFKIVAPTGLALQQAFIYLLQDFIFFGKESCEGSLFPPLFKRIDPEQISKLTYMLFGDTVYVDWRDFLIYCLNIRFPSMEELLSLRRRYRCNDCCNTELIDRDEFISEPLWYEEEFDIDPQDQLRKNLIKHFLFELFEAKENKTNYSALLLAFCKSPDPREGFAKALAMAVGRKICYLWAECEEVVCRLINLKRYHDECLACAHKCANELLDNVLDNVMKACVGTIIEELPWTADTQPTSNKQPKGKKAIKAQSARPAGAAIKQDAESVKAISESNVKQTYICPPCREPSVIEEEKEKWEAPPEEEQSLASEDPCLAYAVPQSIIWNVLKICLPSHFALIPDRKTTPYEEDVREVMKKLEVNHSDGDIYISQFVMEPSICKLLHKVQKFTAYNLTEQVRKICV